MLLGEFSLTLIAEKKTTLLHILFLTHWTERRDELVTFLNRIQVAPISNCGLKTGKS